MDMEVEIIRKSKTIYINNGLTKVDYRKKLYTELLDALQKSNYSFYIEKYNFNSINIRNSDEFSEFLYTVLIIFSGKHNEFFDNNNIFTKPNPMGKLIAPFIRKLDLIPLSNDNPNLFLSRFDIRFTTPNERFIPNDALHSLEHFLGSYITKKTDSLIEISVMGCRTGFLAIFKDNKNINWVVDIIYDSLEKVLESNEIPGAHPNKCWNYLEHDIDGAKMWAKRFLSVPKKNIIVD
jgi:S-ribosylhomocysteine lyase